MKTHNLIPSLGLALYLLCPGCGAPETRMPVQTRAFEVVSHLFAPALPPIPLSEPEVRWWTSPCPGTQESAVVFGDTCYSGLFHGGSGVDVAWRGSIGLSAYSHELMHYYLSLVPGTPDGSDPQHQQTAMWEVVRQTDLTLQQLSL